DKRLEQLKQGKYDGIILAVAGLNRLNLTKEITEYLPADTFIPAVGQGALAIECRKDDEEIIHILRQINDAKIEQGILTERELVRLLDEDDEAPMGAYAEVNGNTTKLYGSVSSLNGKDTKTRQAFGTTPELLAHDAAQQAKE